MWGKAHNEALKKNLEYSSRICQESIRLLDANRYLVEEVVAVRENEAFYLRGASPDYLDGL